MQYLGLIGVVVGAVLAGAATVKSVDQQEAATKATRPATQPATAAVANPDTYLKDVVKLLETHWPRNRVVNIVCHGHSVPAGYFMTPVVDTFNAYPHLFHRALKERFPNAVVNVIVTAIGGEESSEGAARFERDVLTHRPDVITIDYGLNDRRIGLDRAKAAWSSMIEKAQARGIKVILLTPTPDKRVRWDSADDRLGQHAAQIRNLAAQYNVGLVDSLAAFQRKVASGTKVEDLMSSPNHPNRQGHELVQQELIKWFPASTVKE